MKRRGEQLERKRGREGGKERLEVCGRQTDRDKEGPSGDS